MTVNHVALVVDDANRPETTGAYCLRALRRITTVDHSRLGDRGYAPDGYGLYLNIDDGLRFRMGTRLRPSAWWAIDTHLDMSWYMEKGVDFAFVFAAQRVGAVALRKAGIVVARTAIRQALVELGILFVRRPANMSPEFNADLSRN